jgi:hypothetical protein
MKLIYNGTDLAGLADCARVMWPSRSREPAEAPQHERVTVKVSLDFFQQSYEEKADLIEQTRPFFLQELLVSSIECLWRDTRSGESSFEIFPIAP